MYVGCVLCEYVIANLDALLEDKKNEAEIKAALESVCSIMPATVHTTRATYIMTVSRDFLPLLFVEIYRSSFSMESYSLL